MPRFVTQLVTFTALVLLLISPATALARQSPIAEWPMASDVRLSVAGNSRFATDVAGRDAVLRQLASLGLEPRATANCDGPFPVRNGETAWIAGARLDDHAAVVRVLVLVQTDSAGAATGITVLFHDEARVARAYPRDDGIVRTSLAEQRNRRAVQRLHGEGASVPLLAATGTRVFVTVPAAGEEAPTWRLIAYTFDATGAVRSLSTSAPLQTAARLSHR